MVVMNYEKIDMRQLPWRAPDLSPEKKALFDQAARNQGFKEIADLVRHAQPAAESQEGI